MQDVLIESFNSFWLFKRSLFFDVLSNNIPLQVINNYVFEKRLITYFKFEIYLL
jgi:hypothetical protein